LKRRANLVHCTTFVTADTRSILPEGPVQKFVPYLIATLQRAYDGA
jgi:hypothetical protein